MRFKPTYSDKQREAQKRKKEEQIHHRQPKPMPVKPESKHDEVRHLSSSDAA